MKWFFLFCISLFLMFGCKFQRNPLETKDESSAIKWSSLNFPKSGEHFNYVFGVAVNSSRDVFTTTNTGRIFRLSSFDTLWTEVEFVGFKSITFIKFDTLDNLYYGLAHIGTFLGGGVRISIDNGNSWQNYYESIKDSKGMSFFQGKTYIVGNNDISISSDNGKTWNNYIIDENEIDIESIIIDKINGFIFVGTFQKGIFRSEDGGVSWNHNSFADWSIFPLCSTFNGNIFAVSGVGLFVSKDHGDTWNKINNEISEFRIRCMKQTIEDDLIVGTDEEGLFLTKDYGNNWTYLGLSDTTILSLDIDKEGYIYVGTDSVGVFKSSFTLHDIN